MVFTAFLLGVQHKRDSLENMSASFLVASWARLDWMPPSLCGIHVAGPSSTPVLVARSNRRLAKRARKKLIS